MTDQKREEALRRCIGATNSSDGACFRAGYDAALADNAERVRELEGGLRAAVAQVRELEAKRVLAVKAFDNRQSDYLAARDRADAAESALADNAERLRELKNMHECQEIELTDAQKDLAEARATIAQLQEADLMRERAADEALKELDNILPTVAQELEPMSELMRELAEARSIADRPLGTHIDYEPMDMIRDLQKALGTRVHDREPCRCGNVNDLAEARATIERLNTVIAVHAREWGLP